MSMEQPWPSIDDWDVTCWHSAVAPVVGQRGPATEVRRAARACDYVVGLTRGIRGLRVGIAETYAFDGLSEDVLAVLNGTLTLPGIAGFVLTIGTAVDANVLINERIREERRRGRSVIQAVELGYKEASRTIFEANMTHGISGVIMFLLGSGPIKGFAVVLLIGIATSVFTAVTFTRMLVVLWLRKNRPQTINI